MKNLLSRTLAALLIGTSLVGAAEAATLISTASGNIDATGTWSVVDTTGSNAYLNSETANTALTTSAVASSTFTPAAETITEIGVKLASVTVSPLGTMTVKLANSTSPGVRECTATVNATDLTAVSAPPAAATLDGGWVLLSCSASPNGTDSYTIQASASVGATINLFSLATTNWSHLLVTNGTQSGGPAAGDKFIVSGVLTGAGTHSAYVVTVETTANVSYGNVANTLVDPSIAICQYGTLQFANAASTNYKMEFAGPLVNYNGGTFTQGTVGSPIPASSTAILTLNSSVEGDTGVNNRNGSVRSVVGSSGGRNVSKTHLSVTATGSGNVTTNAGTSSSSASIHVASLPTNIIVGMLVSDTTNPSAIAGGTTVTALSTGTITMSANAVGSGIVSGDNIAFGTPQTSLTTSDVTGWLSGDQIYIAGTQITNGFGQVGAGYKGEAATLSGNASGSTAPLSASVTQTHTAESISYTSANTGVAYSMNMFADVILLTRNVTVQGSGTSTNGYEFSQANASVTVSWARYTMMSGLNSSPGKRGFEADTGPLGLLSVTNASFDTSHHIPMLLAPTNTNFGGSSGSPVVIQHVTFNNVSTDSVSGTGPALSMVATSKNVFLKFDDIAVVFCSMNTLTSAISLLGTQYQFTNISISGCGEGGVGQWAANGAYGSHGTIGGGVNSWGPISLYSNTGYPSTTGNFGPGTGTINGLYIWHEQGRFSWGSSGGNLIIDPFYIVTSSFGLYTFSGNSITLRNGVIGYEVGVSSSATTSALTLDSNPNPAFYFDNMELCPTGSLGGISWQTCANPIISIVTDLSVEGGSLPTATRVFLRNTSVLAPVPYPTFNGQEAYYSQNGFVVQDCAGCSLKHAAWVLGGFLNYDATISHSSGYSLRMTPRVNSYLGYISAGSGLSTPGSVLTITTGGLNSNTIGDYVASAASGFVPGTMMNNTASLNPPYSVSQTQSVGAPGSPVQFLSYNGTFGNTPPRMQSAPAGMGQKIAVASGVSTAQACVWVRPSANTDAAPPWGGSAVTYNGDNPRMIVRQNPYMGVQSDTVIGTSSGLTAGSWTQFCATLPTAPNDGEYEVVVDADQTFTSNAGGSVNVAEWSCTNCVNSNNSQFWWNGAPGNTVAPASGGSGGKGGRIIGGFLLERDLKPASNDNSPPWLDKAA